MAISWQKPLLFVLLLTPFLLLLSDVILGNLIDPIEEITNPTGQWALRFLLLGLLITPLNKILPFLLIKYRRMIGMFPKSKNRTNNNPKPHQTSKKITTTFKLCNS